MDIKKQATEYVNKKYSLFTEKLKQILVDVYIEGYKNCAKDNLEQFIKDNPEYKTIVESKEWASSDLPKDIKDRQTEFLNSCRPKVEKSCVNCGQIKDERCRGRRTNVCENWTPKADKVEKGENK